MARFLRLMASLEDNWLGDVLGVICLWGFALSVYFLGFGWGL